jgi:fructose/tagatose bisphosphate aldolase
VRIRRSWIAWVAEGRTGANILAPCVGNRHGSYKPFGGPDWDLDL